MARRMPSGRDVIVAMFVLLLLPVSAAAQRPANSFDKLSQLIKPGDTVSITEADGGRVKGEVAEVTPSSITLLISHNGDRPGSANSTTKVEERRTFPEAAVRRIVYRDSLWNGALIGAGVGTLWGPLGPSVSLGLVPGIGVGAAIGAAIGTGIDALITEPVYESTQHTRSVTLAPVFRSDRHAVLVCITF